MKSYKAKHKEEKKTMEKEKKFEVLYGTVFFIESTDVREKAISKARELEASSLFEQVNMLKATFREKNNRKKWEEYILAFDPKPQICYIGGIRFFEKNPIILALRVQSELEKRGGKTIRQERGEDGIKFMFRFSDNVSRDSWEEKMESI